MVCQIFSATQYISPEFAHFFTHTVFSLSPLSLTEAFTLKKFQRFPHARNHMLFLQQQQHKNKKRGKQIQQREENILGFIFRKIFEFSTTFLSIKLKRAAFLLCCPLVVVVLVVVDTVAVVVVSLSFAPTPNPNMSLIESYSKCDDCCCCCLFSSN